MRLGSSPRGRGKRVFDAEPDVRRGLIPAWAGKTRSQGCRGCSTPAHPRVGGENHEIATSADLTAGSSPRGRGKRNHDVAPNRRAGLIPAWAGKTV